MARRQTPPEWQALLDKAGISSLNRLAELAGLSTTTVTRTAHRDHQPGSETVTALATVLRVPESTIYQLTHGQGIKVRKWEPPAEVNRLSKRSQDAVTEMIRALVAEQEQREDGGEHGQGSAPMNEPDDKVAQLRPEDRPATRKFTPRWERDEEAASEGEKGISVDEIPDEST